MPTVQKQRKIFNYDNFEESKIIPKLDKNYTYEKTVSAAGCLFYKTTNNKLELLLISYVDPKWNNLDDLGGQVDEIDNTPYDTIIRETMEETNDVIKKSYLQQIIKKQKYTSYYNQFSKYYSIVVEVNNDFFPNTDIFGNFEIKDGIERTIDWYDYSTIKDKICSRIKCNKNIINFLNTLDENCNNVE